MALCLHRPANDGDGRMDTLRTLMLVATMASAGVATAGSGQRFNVPSDPRATYTMLSVTRGKGGRVLALSRRDGPSGTRYSRREIDCRAMMFRYTGEGDTETQALRPDPSADKMGPLVSGSISDVASRLACRIARQ